MLIIIKGCLTRKKSVIIMKKEDKPLYYFLRNLANVLLRILYRPKKIDKENIPQEGPIILAGNHVNAIDPVMVITSTKRLVHYMAKESLFKGIHGWIFKKVGTIKVHRNKSNPVAVMEAEDILKHGGAVGIFPEGTRNRTNEDLLKFRHGTVSIAKKTNSKIVPFAIRGKYKIFRKGLSIKFGKPIDVSNMEIEEANDYLRGEVLKLLKG